MQLLKQVIDVGQRILVFDGLLVDAPVVLDQPASTIFLLHKKTRGTPRRSARANEPIFFQFHQLLLQLNQLFWTHLVRMPRYRLCTRLQFDDELNSTHGWNTWQLLWKDIWKVANNSDLPEQGSNSSVQSVQLCCSRCRA